MKEKKGRRNSGRKGRGRDEMNERLRGRGRTKGGEDEEVGGEVKEREG